MVLAAIWSFDYLTKNKTNNDLGPELVWSLTGGAFNVLASVLAWWRCFANNYLHWAAIGTWVLFNLQGECQVD